ncbi:NAD(P)-dependent oxidoreductase [Billgrantia kenyensis]|uniref:NAD(P)-dependent oxidoreductase n=1 Tax=Billgrantia kenyensis TaxID=321266 RepID=A0A7V9W4B2_9GAMM|nr:NAD(P)-dependent oxidoreductase [Halomonas kenyensis]MBA2780793.1 NAD(P)-dependent oxidoreductase [Halomonas kenyensis]MCG6663618.1 NAD(P)-dependent oxidoreductase [Halomonas kenyensis]
MNASTLDPVLLIGGAGRVGSRAARSLRSMHPELPIAIAGRDLGKARQLASEIGHVSAVAVDLDRDDLGLDGSAAFSAVVVLLKDDSLNALQFAQAHGVPYVAISDYAFDIGPEVALAIARPTAAPVLLLGHFLGGIAVLATLHAVRDFQRVNSIEMAAIFSPADMGGPTAQADMSRVAGIAPHPLMLVDGHWVWAAGAEAQRTFMDIDGVTRQGQAYPLLDVVSLAAVTDAMSVRIDAAMREDEDSPPGHRLIIDVAGVGRYGESQRTRWVIEDSDFHQGMSGMGLALAIERLLGLDGSKPVAPGLYHPETLLQPEDAIERLRTAGVSIRACPVPGQSAVK